MKIAASFLSCSNIKDAIKKLDVTDTDYIHVDVIDGKFVSGTEIPIRKLKKIYKYTSKRLQVHLMVDKPKNYIKKFALLNTDTIIIHVEVKENLEENLNLIHSYAMKNGLAINPDTDISLLKPYLDKIDTILVMSVNPGLGGQEFISSSVDRIKQIKKMIGKKRIQLVVDGGIKMEQALILKKIPVNIIVAGSYITNSDDYQASIDKLR